MPAAFSAIRIGLALIPAIKAGFAEYKIDAADGKITPEDVADIALSVIRKALPVLVTEIARVVGITVPVDIVAKLSETI